VFLYLTSLGFKDPSLKTTVSYSKSSKIFSPSSVEADKKLQKNARLTVAFDKTSFEYWRHQMDLFVKQDFIKRWTR
jgi:hypothetical protein